MKSIPPGLKRMRLGNILRDVGLGRNLMSISLRRIPTGVSLCRILMRISSTKISMTRSVGRRAVDRRVTVCARRVPTPISRKLPDSKDAVGWPSLTVARAQYRCTDG